CARWLSSISRPSTSFLQRWCGPTRLTLFPYTTLFRSALFSSSLGMVTYHLVLISTVLFWATQATSWNLLSGFAGYFSFGQGAFRSEEHTSELQSRENLVCRLLLEKKKDT